MDLTDVPAYDPKRHTDGEAFVLVEMAADTGDLFRRADPLRVIEPDAREWVRRMVDIGAKPASMQWAINARSGTPPQGDRASGAADYSDTKVPKSWPFEPADEPSEFAATTSTEEG